MVRSSDAFLTATLLVAGIILWPIDPPRGADQNLGSDQISTTDWYPLKGDSSVIVFATGDTLHLPATKVSLQGKLITPLGKPWYLFSGMDSAQHGARQALYVVSPGHHLGPPLHRTWYMPGKLKDHGGEETYYEAEVFSGEVLPDTIGIIWYDRSLMPDGKWRINTTLLDLNGPEPDTIVLFGHGRKSLTQRLAFRGKCMVLPGLDQVVQP